MIEREDEKGYISIRGVFTLCYPESWTLLDDENGIANLFNPRGTGTITVSAAKHQSDTFIANACQQLQRYGSQFSAEVGRLALLECSPTLAIGEYASPAEDYWRVQFKTFRNIVVFATYNEKLIDRQPDTDNEVRMILASIRIQSPDLRALGQKH
jgi:hypothetical protein